VLVLIGAAGAGAGARTPRGAGADVRVVAHQHSAGWSASTSGLHRNESDRSDSFRTQGIRDTPKRSDAGHRTGAGHASDIVSPACAGRSHNPNVVAPRPRCAKLLKIRTKSSAVQRPIARVRQTNPLGSCAGGSSSTRPARQNILIRQNVPGTSPLTAPDNTVPTVPGFVPSLASKSATARCRCSVIRCE
jgi:hypothetical protein